MNSIFSIPNLVDQTSEGLHLNIPSSKYFKMMTIAAIALAAIGLVFYWLWTSQWLSLQEKKLVIEKEKSPLPVHKVDKVVEVIVKEESPSLAPKVEDEEKAVEVPKSPAPIHTDGGAQFPPLPDINYEKLLLELNDKTEHVPTLPYSMTCCRYNDVLCPAMWTYKSRDYDKDGLYLHANHIDLEGRWSAVQYPYPFQIPYLWDWSKSIIIDLTNQHDIDKGLKPPYYPTQLGESKQYDATTVTYISFQTFKNQPFLIHNYGVKTNFEYEMVGFSKRLSFDGWDEKEGIRHEDLDRLIDVMQQFTYKRSGPAILCGGGIGRSAVLIVACALQCLINQDKVNHSNFFDVLSDLILRGRKQRGPKFVPAEKHLKLLCEWGWKAMQRGPRQFQTLEVIEEIKA